MSREVRRVPLDFDAPLNQVWHGYVMPDSLKGEKCPDCSGGQTWAGWWLQRFCQRLGMLASDVREQGRGRPLHPWLENDPYPAMTDWEYEYGPDGRPSRLIREPQVMRPSRDILALIAGLTDQTEAEVASPFGQQDHVIFRKIVEAAGLDTWGGCGTCQGHGSLETYEGQRADADAWKPTPPPAGEGWQLWSTAGDPMPVSPVFAGEHDFAVWMSTVYKPVGGPLSYEQARRFISVGFTLGSGVITAEGVVPNEHGTLLLEGGE